MTNLDDRCINGVLNFFVIICDGLSAYHECPTHRKWEWLDKRGLGLDGELFPRAVLPVLIFDGDGESLQHTTVWLLG